jgi:hypothetical protein
VVRKDLPRGILEAMVCHAAGESSPGNLPAGTYAIVLSAPDEAALTREADRLEARGVRMVRITEPDAPWNGQLMALGLEPARKEALRRHLSCLPLLR